MSLAFLQSVVFGAVLAGTPILYATLAEIVGERAGIVNLGLEGIMLMGAVDPSLFRNLTLPRPERAVLGVAYEGDNWTGDRSLYRPFRVEVASHRFFAGANLSNADLIGDHGRNGAASGWKMDTSQQLPGKAPGLPPANIQVLARGTNTGPDNTYSADMTYYDTPAGGFVFAAGSLTVGGSLVVDPHLQRIVRNVLDECLAAP
jgi:hypothetical protein